MIRDESVGRFDEAIGQERALRRRAPRTSARIRRAGYSWSTRNGEAKLAFANAGIVSRIDVHVGEAVTAGEALAQLDTSGLVIDAAQARSDAAAAAASYGGGTVPQRALMSAQARLAAARSKLRALETGAGAAQSDREAALAAVRQSEAKLSNDQRALDRESTLYAGGVAALKDVEAARQQLVFDRADADANRAKAASAGSNIGASLTQARADVAQAESDDGTAQAQVTVTGAQASSAQARYEAAQRLLAIATLHATADGVVTAILKHPGEAVDPTQPAVVVGPPSSNDVTLAVPGDDAREIQPGDPVTILVTNRGRSGAGGVRGVVKRDVCPWLQPCRFRPGGSRFRERSTARARLRPPRRQRLQPPPAVPERWPPERTERAKHPASPALARARRM